MAVSLQADPVLPLGYIQVNGTTAITVSTTGISGSFLPAWKTKTTTYTAVNGDYILADTSAGAWTLTLPAAPALGAQVVVADNSGYWATNNLTVFRNGSTLNGLSEDLTGDKNGKVLTFYFNGTTWRILF